MGNQVLVYYAKWDTDQILICPRDATGKLTDPLVAYRNREFGIVDKSGAIESGRRVSLMNKGIRDMKQGSRKVDTVTEMGKFAQLSPLPRSFHSAQNYAARRVQGDSGSCRAGRRSAQGRTGQALAWAVV